MRNQPARRKTDSTRRVNGKLQWRVYGLGWVSTKTMITLVVITVILIVLIFLGF